jgi:hypothetical protein
MVLMADEMPDRIWAAQFLGEREWNTSPPEDKALGAVEYMRVPPTVKNVEPNTPSESGIKYMSVKEFREAGYLQELNRRFLHPLGLALEVVMQANNQEYFGRIWDCRDDPEGWLFDDGLIDREKGDRIEKERLARYGARVEKLGFYVQPLPEAEDASASGD